MMSIALFVQQMEGAGIGLDRLLLDEPLSRHTTFRIGGPADVLFSAASQREAAVCCRLAQGAGLPLTVLGNGSNVLVSDKGLRGVVLVLGRDFSQVTAEGSRLTAQAGASLKAAAQAALEAGLTGLEPVSGIPGNVGGAVYMNAGAYGGFVSQGIERVGLLDPKTGEVSECDGEAMAFGYRTSLAMTRGLIVLWARWNLKKAPGEEIRGAMEDFTRQRREKQPLEYPSAGSVFKRPTGHFAGRLIEQAGLKGYAVGDAQVSPLHAGFIINTGHATAAQVRALIAHIQKRVLEESGVLLEPEIRILGE
jgi:UDP-N-acetylmuramate dehydrogenase